MTIGILFLLFVCFCIGYTVLRICTKMFGAKKSSKGQVNPYIWYHSRKLKDDMDYKEYLEFCAKVGEAPVDQVGFNDIRRKESAIRSLVQNPK